MTWFKVDDAFWAHPKVLALSDAAIALWVRAGSYCAQHLTDGKVPAAVLPMLRSDEFIASDLVSAGLWLNTPDGYEFHDWAKYQPTRESIEAERELWRERQRASRAKRVTRDTSGAPVDKFTEPVDKFKGGEESAESRGNVTRDSRRESSSPVPSRPVPDSSNDESQNALDVVVDSTFDQVWAQWPRKQSKKAAQAKFALAAKRHEGGARGLAADIVEHARAYVRFDHPVEFVPMLSTWLNGDRWTDTLPGPRSSASTPQRDQNAAVLSRYANEGDHS